jgi:hypothetical protein
MLKLLIQKKTKKLRRKKNNTGESKKKPLKKKPPKKKPVIKEPTTPPKVRGKDIPYPGRRNIDHYKEVFDYFAKYFSKISLELPIADAIKVPTYKKFL